MGRKRDSADEAFQERVRITLTESKVLDGLIGLYGSTRGEVMAYLIRSGLDRLGERRPLDLQLKEVKRLRAAPGGGKRKAGVGE